MRVYCVCIALYYDSTPKECLGRIETLGRLRGSTEEDQTRQTVDVLQAGYAISFSLFFFFLFFFSFFFACAQVFDTFWIP